MGLVGKAQATKTAVNILLCISIMGMLISPVIAQDQTFTGSNSISDADRKTKMAGQINVKPASYDSAIDQRITGILEATGWFSDIAVQVEEGIVFLDGKTATEENSAWAGELAGKIVDVVAVVNRIQVIQRSRWDVTPAVNELKELWKNTLQGLPRVGLAVVFLLFVWLFAKLSIRGIATLLDHRLNPLLRDVTVRLINILVFLLGCYLALQIAGLSNLSTTILGGTGIAGLIAGIAFRDLLENYLASILISIRNPFRLGDLVEINDHLGVVELVTTRGTVLMNPDGNHVQIPNSIVYKGIIRNYTANPNRREMFEVGIGYDSSTSAAQEIVLEIINNHPAVLSEPEPLVLVDSLGAATVNLKSYFWYDGSFYNGLKVKSALIRLVKRVFEEKGISMPDEAREIVFPDGVPVHMLDSAVKTKPYKPEEDDLSSITDSEAILTESEAISTEAEGSLENEEPQLREQARLARPPEEGESLLRK